MYPHGVLGWTVSSTTWTVDPFHVSIILLPLRVVTRVHCFRRLVLENDLISWASDCITCVDVDLGNAKYDKLLSFKLLDPWCDPCLLCSRSCIGGCLLFLQSGKLRRLITWSQISEALRTIVPPRGAHHHIKGQRWPTWMILYGQRLAVWCKYQYCQNCQMLSNFDIDKKKKIILIFKS